MSRAQATRDRVLHAAEELLRSGHPASMGSIARAAGVTRQLLYLHFSSRAGLLLELSARVDARVRTPGLQALVDEAPDARTALRQAVVVQGRIKPQLAAVVRAVDRLRPDDADARAAWQAREDARYGRALDVVHRLASEGVLRDGLDVDEAARWLWSVTSQHAWDDLVGDVGWTPEQWVDRTAALLEHALCRP